MKSCLWEYADCDVNEIAEKYIEEKPQIGEIPVAPDERENTPLIQGTGVEDTTITEENYVGQVKEDRKDYDLLSALMLCLGDPEEDEDQGILRLLSVLLSIEIKAGQKKEILEKEYHIEMSQKFEEEVSQMCNLSEGVEQKGIQKGILESISNLMDTMNWTAKEAMDALKIKEEERSLYEKLLKDKKAD